MPGILDLAEMFMNELKLTKKFGKEIEAMDAADRKGAQGLMPDLGKCVDLPALQQFNDKLRKWIDNHPRP